MVVCWSFQVSITSSQFRISNHHYTQHPHPFEMSRIGFCHPMFPVICTTCSSCPWIFQLFFPGFPFSNTGWVECDNRIPTPKVEISTLDFAANRTCVYESIEISCRSQALSPDLGHTEFSLLFHEWSERRGGSAQWDDLLWWPTALMLFWCRHPLSLTRYIYSSSFGYFRIICLSNFEPSFIPIHSPILYHSGYELELDRLISQHGST